MKYQKVKKTIEKFKKSINLDFLELGVTKTFTDQINNLAFVYAFDEMQMAGLYNESINKSGLFDYRLLKKKANVLYSYLHHMNAPKLLTKDEENIENVRFIEDNFPLKLVDISTYVPKDFGRNTAKDGYKSPNDVFEYQDKSYTYDLMIKDTVLSPKIGLSVKETSYYYQCRRCWRFD